MLLSSWKVSYFIIQCYLFYITYCQKAFCYFSPRSSQDFLNTIQPSQAPAPRGQLRILAATCFQSSPGGADLPCTGDHSVIYDQIGVHHSLCRSPEPGLQLQNHCWKEGATPPPPIEQAWFVLHNMLGRKSTP